MCIAILNAKDVLTLKTFKTCWSANPDGAGLAYYDGENIQMIKEMKSVKVFYDKYLIIRKQYPNIDIAIHFRIATHGRINVTNCHPFKVNRKTAFIHNGMITHLEKHPEFSDTYLFNESIVKQLPANFIHNTAIIEMLGNYIGYSKLVIISGENAVIVNEQLGQWDGGNWYSNSSYKPYKEVSYKKASEYKYSYKDWGDIDSPKMIYDQKSKTMIEEKAPQICDCCTSVVSSTKYNREFNAHICHSCNLYFEEQSELW